jgi:hypothetical protein
VHATHALSRRRRSARAILAHDGSLRVADRGSVW